MAYPDMTAPITVTKSASASSFVRWLRNRAAGVSRAIGVISARSEVTLAFVSDDFFSPIEEAMFELLVTQLADSDGALPGQCWTLTELPKTKTPRTSINLSRITSANENSGKASVGSIPSRSTAAWEPGQGSSTVRTAAIRRQKH